MKGTILRYGRQGDPIIQPENGGKIVILTEYGSLPGVGATVEYNVTKQARSVDYAALTPQTPNPERKQIEIPEGSLESSIRAIQALWDEKFVPHMSNEAKAVFPTELEKIKSRYASGDRVGAAKIAHGIWEWATHSSNFCEISPIGFSYFTMARKVEDLEKLLK